MALSLLIRGLGLLLAFALLTALTQIGGVVLVAAWLGARLLRPRGRRAAASMALFVVLYAGASLWIVPPLAAVGGRQPLPCSLADDAPVRPHSFLYCALNRHYATPRVADMLAAAGNDLSRQFPGIQIAYLDANFPFFDGFPLPPHLSHDDGRKIDLAFFYRDALGRPSAVITPSPIGYWGFEQPRAGDPTPCRREGGLLTLRWDMSWLQPLLPSGALHVEANHALMRWLTSQGQRHGVERLLLEPHLQRRLQVGGPLVRFQGCYAARHDDHVHIQVRL